jgi:hypothetical protein
MFFDESGLFPDTCRELIRSLRGAAIDHVFVGTVALKAYGCNHQEDTIEFCLRQLDVEHFRGELSGYVYEQLPGQPVRYCHPTTQIRIEVLISGEVAGDRLRQQEITYPDPSEAEFVDGVPVPSLARLIELKLATWDPRDQRDVAALIGANRLDTSFAKDVHALVRPAYVECCTLEAQRAARHSY